MTRNCRCASSGTKVACRHDFMNWFNNYVNSVGKLQISWVDFLTIIVLLIGIVRGRKRGLSEEMLDTIQWVLIIVAGGFLYKGLGKALSVKPIFSQLTC